MTDEEAAALLRLALTIRTVGKITLMFVIIVLLALLFYKGVQAITAFLISKLFLQCEECGEVTQIDFIEK